MSDKGNCYEFKTVRASGLNDPGDHSEAQNAAVETFFQTIKAEMIWRQSWETRKQAEFAIFEYINGYYNPKRRHSALGWKSRVVFERKVA